MCYAQKYLHTSFLQKSCLKNMASVLASGLCSCLRTFVDMRLTVLKKKKNVFRKTNGNKDVLPGV